MDNYAEINNKERNLYCKNDVCNRYSGAYISDNGEAVFKIFAYPDTESVLLEYKPSVREIYTVSMTKTSDCIWETVLPEGTLKCGDRYRFVLTRNGRQITVKDPCSMWQDSYFKWSRLYNHGEYPWTDQKWMQGADKRRISRLADEYNMLLPVGALRIYELHIGTFTDEGTFKSAKEKLKHIASDLNFNAIEIMPVENTYSFNWGYDGADKYAPNHTYGKPDDLKELIDYAHECGLNVIMDTVPNHLGPDLEELSKTGPYLECENCFGYKFNFEKDDHSHHVRDYIIGSAVNWAVNYHCDGLRVDMTKFMCSDYTMKQMAAEINYRSPHSFLIAEDGRDNDERVTRPFSPSEVDKNLLSHEKFINEIRNNNVSLAGIGFDTEWDFPFHKQIAASVLGVWDCRVKSLYNLDRSLKDAQYRVKYPMSHDEIGNIDGTRLISKIIVNLLKLNDKVCDCHMSLKCQLTAQAAHKITVALLDGSLEKMTEHEQIEFFKANNLRDTLSVDEIFSAYVTAVKMHKLASGKVYSVPGPKMIFQGDENANIAYFKFFRKFSTGPEYYLREKGYEPGLSAFLDSKLSSVKVCDKYSYINDGVEKYTSDLNNLCKNNQALSSGHIEKTLLHENSEIHAIHARHMYNEIFSVSNFSSTGYVNNYGIMFPKGEWREILNSDAVEYAGSGEYLNGDKIFKNFSQVSVSGYGIVFFEKL